MIKRLDQPALWSRISRLAVAFFVELGLELEVEATVEGEWVDQLLGLDDVHTDIAMLRTPDGQGRVELSTSTRPWPQALRRGRR